MTKKNPSKRGKGRPPKTEGPTFDRNALDKLLVHGEPTNGGEGVHYPSHTELAKRFGISRSAVSKYAKRHDTRNRRRRASEVAMVAPDDRIMRARSEAEALTTEDLLRVIDTYLRGFEKALVEGRVRFDSVTDFNTMSRLKTFLLEGRDGPEESGVDFSLADLQARYAAHLARQEASAMVTASRSINGEDGQA